MHTHMNTHKYDGENCKKIISGILIEWFAKEQLFTCIRNLSLYSWLLRVTEYCGMSIFFILWVMYFEVLLKRSIS